MSEHTRILISPKEIALIRKAAKSSGGVYKAAYCCDTINQNQLIFDVIVYENKSFCTRIKSYLNHTIPGGYFDLPTNMPPYSNLTFLGVAEPYQNNEYD